MHLIAAHIYVTVIWFISGLAVMLRDMPVSKIHYGCLFISYLVVALENIFHMSLLYANENTKERKIMHNPLKSIFRKTILVKYHDPELTPIGQISIGDWIDLRAAETVELKAGEEKLISLGVSMKLPKGYEAHIEPRSSTFKTWHILQTNSMGVIDQSYCGDNDIWKYPVLATKDTIIKKNDRICQFRIMKKMKKVNIKTVETLSSPDRGGFGSTGTN